MATKTVVSATKVKVRAAQIGKNLRQVNKEAGLANNSIYQMTGRSNVQLETIDKLAAALQCSTLDLLEEIGVDTLESVHQQLIAELPDIIKRNDAANGWVSSDEMRRLMAERGVDVN